jgi:hypothetical protein
MLRYTYVACLVLNNQMRRGGWRVENTCWCTASLAAYCMTHGLLLPYETILRVDLTKNEYYITCQGQAKVFLGGGKGGGASVKQLILPWP